MPRKKLESYKLFYEQIPAIEWEVEQKPKRLAKAKAVKAAKLEERDYPTVSVLATEAEGVNL